MILLDDGKVAFLDFGLFKSVAPEITEHELACQRAGRRGRRAGTAQAADRDRLHPRAGEARSRRPDGLRGRRDLVVHAGPDRARSTRRWSRPVMIETGDPRSKHFATMRHQDIVPEHLFGRRARAAHARRPRPARGRGQLAPDRPRVDVRRRPGDRAGARRGDLLRQGIGPAAGSGAGSGSGFGSGLAGLSARPERCKDVSGSVCSEGGCSGWGWSLRRRSACGIGVDSR